MRARGNASIDDYQIDSKAISLMAISPAKRLPFKTGAHLSARNNSPDINHFRIEMALPPLLAQGLT
ncbi:MAG TPA: hypothetical protein VJ810_21790 [Blastocatellia bacterium]|nr:hypothetical protein [Blastocatellia bacterium]